ncbi:MAG: hypothetical protein IJZ86_07045 [Bacteroides sp.]|nr:hypothetical protein [Bacteroides sp.]
MKKVSCSILLLVAVLFTACQEKRVSSDFADAVSFGYEDFKETQTLHAAEWGMDSLLATPVQLKVCENLLLVMNSRDERMLHVFDLNTKQLLAKHIAVGQGPNDMLAPRFADMDDSYLYVYDIMTSEVAKYLKSELADTALLVKQTKVKPKKRSMGEARVLGEGFVAPARSANFKLYQYNVQGEVVDTLGRNPQVSWNTTPKEQIDMFEFACLTDKREKIALFYYWTDLLDIYDKEGNLLKRLHGPEGFVSPFKEVQRGQIMMAAPVDGKTRAAYIVPQSVGDELWVLFSNRLSNDENYLDTQILVFDWEGNPLRILNLNQGIFSFAVDETHRKIYGISDSPEFHILEYAY